jgi:hypothetical protein
MRWQRMLVAGLAGSLACAGDGTPRIMGVSGGDGGGGAAGPATHLVFTAGPGAANAGVTMGTIQVTAEDSVGATDPTFTGSVSIAIGANPSGGTLTGTTTVAAQSGVATFSDLRIDQPGSGYTLAASAGGLAAAASASFNVQ